MPIEGFRDKPTTSKVADRKRNLIDRELAEYWEKGASSDSDCFIPESESNSEYSPSESDSATDSDSDDQAEIDKELEGSPHENIADTTISSTSNWFDVTDNYQQKFQFI
ncbi:hypothetical protein QE152_g33197 [Popillia japonica]|uniref:Uncharacterized protein n=1 Tax=Popillia japonica TaxID=7064 RepID=A0AAW1IXW6_POPJA